jgi:hypothetical protein
MHGTASDRNTAWLRLAMTEQVAASGAGLSRSLPHPRWRAGTGPAAAEHYGSPPERPRVLPLALGFLWLLDAMLQFQSVMFGRGFAVMLRAAASGNPAVIAAPIAWSSRLIQQHDALANAAFAAIQLAIALGIAWRPTIRIALGVSIGWSLAVWWLGEGLGGLLSGSGGPVSGAPGAVVVYALLAILLWPPRRDRPAPFVAARAVGASAARLAWLVVWGALAALALLPATRAPRALAATIASLSAGQPRWLGGLDHRLAAFLSHRGPAAAVLLAAILAVVAAGIYLPRPAVRGVLVLAIATASALWLAQGLGGLLTGSGTDPGTAPVLALLALAYWPRPDAAGTAAVSQRLHGGRA